MSEGWIIPDDPNNQKLAEQMGKIMEYTINRAIEISIGTGLDLNYVIDNFEFLDKEEENGDTMVDDELFMVGDCVSREELNVQDDVPSKIEFNIDDKVLITLSNDGITIHRDNFPDFKPDDFVEKFCYLIENSFDVKFERKNQDDQEKIL